MTVPRWLLAGGCALLLIATLGLGFVLTHRGTGSTVADFHGAPTGPAPAVPSPPGSSSASPSASTSPAPPGLAAAHGGSGASLHQVDGGPGYYARFSSPLPTSPSFFPIGVWFEAVTQPSDAARDKAAGINTYVQLTDGSDVSLVRAAGMYAIHSNAKGTGVGAETSGWLLTDETDMWGGPGSAAWTGKYPGQGDVCAPAGAHCGYTVQRTVRQQYPADGRMRYANYGKGVTFWESDSEAATFVNQFQDLVSDDNYWFTDQNICGTSEGGTLFAGHALAAADCHKASNYGRTVDRLRGLVSPAGSKPVWGFVEVGHPFTEGDWPSATPQQVVAGVWSSIIHGARGIIYFNHSFAGPCQTQHALRDPCYAAVRAAVTTVDSQIRALAPVLNAPVVSGVVKGSPAVDVATKWYDGHFYVLAGANQTAAQTATFTLPCVGPATVTVLNEDRTLPVSGGAFRDRFADSNAVHVYRVDGGSSCGAY